MPPKIQLLFAAAALVLLVGCDDDPPHPVRVIPSPSPTPTVAPLGKRRFEIQSSNSPVLLALGGDSVLRLGTFLGQSDGENETGFVDLEAGAPDPQTGIAKLRVTDSSDYLYARLPAIGGIFCLQITPTAEDVGIIDCDGGSDLSVHLQIDHHLGELDSDGFTAADCFAAGGKIEGAAKLCAAGQVLADCRANADCDSAEGIGDGMCGLADATCTAPARKVGDACRNDADCDRRADTARGRCGSILPHVGVCNGPLERLTDHGDSGAGAVAFAPNESLGVRGLAGRFIIENKLPCGDEGQGTELTFAMTSAVAQGTIRDFGNESQQVVDFTMPQASQASPQDRELQNFSCNDWTADDAPGCLGLVVPTLDLNPSGGDLMPAFKLCGR